MNRSGRGAQQHDLGEHSAVLNDGCQTVLAVMLVFKLCQASQLAWWSMVEGHREKNITTWWLLSPELAGWLAGYDDLDFARVADDLRSERQAVLGTRRSARISLRVPPARQHHAAAPTAGEARAMGTAPERAWPRPIGRCSCGQREDVCGCPEACHQDGCLSCRGALHGAGDDGADVAASSREMEARLAALEAEVAECRGVRRGLSELQEEVSVLRQAQLDVQVQAPKLVADLKRRPMASQG